MAWAGFSSYSLSYYCPEPYFLGHGYQKSKVATEWGIGGRFQTNRWKSWPRAGREPKPKVKSLGWEEGSNRREGGEEDYGNNCCTSSPSRKLAWNKQYQMTSWRLIGSQTSKAQCPDFKSTYVVLPNLKPIRQVVRLQLLPSETGVPYSCRALSTKS